VAQPTPTPAAAAPRSVLGRGAGWQPHGDARPGVGRSRGHRGLRQEGADGPGQKPTSAGMRHRNAAPTPPRTCRPTWSNCALNAGAKSVSIFDNPCDQWQRTYANSGIAAGPPRTPVPSSSTARMRAFTREVEIPGGIKLKHAQVALPGVGQRRFHQRPGAQAP